MQLMLLPSFITMNSYISIHSFPIGTGGSAPARIPDTHASLTQRKITFIAELYNRSIHDCITNKSKSNVSHG